MKYTDIASRFADFAELAKSTAEFSKLELSTSFCDSKASTDYVVKLLEKAGFSDIEQYAIPADGVTTYDDCTMPQAWDRTGRSTLEIIEPALPENERLLADSDAEVINLPTWSAPTPPEGITGELMLFSTIKSDDFHEAAGKIVLCDFSPGGARARKLCQAGALGTVAFVRDIAEALPDDVRWMNGVGCCGWYHIKGDKRPWNFSITPRRGLALEKRLLAGEKVVLRAVVNTKIYDGEIYTVTARIPGESESEVALFAHMYEPFPADDAIGVTACVEIGRVLLEAIKAGAVPKLKKTLRVVFSMERYGFYEYLQNAKRRQNLVYTLNMDAITNSAWKLCKTPRNIRHSSAAVPFFGEILIRELMDKICPQVNYLESAGSLSDDTFSADSLWNIPSNWLTSPCPNGMHHNTNDIFAAVAWDEVPGDLDVVTGLLCALMTDTDADYNAEIRSKVLAGVKLDAAKDLEKLANAAKISDLDAEAVQTLYAFLKDYHRKRIISLNSYWQDIVSEQDISNTLDPLFADFTPAAAATTTHTAAAAAMRGIKVSRNASKLQPMSLAVVPQEERYAIKVFPSALCCAMLDGKRSLYEAWLISEFMLYGKISTANAADLVKFFQKLSKYGYYTIN